MDWLKIVTVLTLLFSGYMAWRQYQLKKDVYDFARKIEESLDAVIMGKRMQSAEEITDTLFGRVNEKLARAEDILESKERESLEGKRQMKELISDISHQTKTPIANQKLCLEVLKQEGLSAEGRMFLERLEQQTDKLDFLLQSLVKMSRLETGVIQIQKKEADLIYTIRQAVSGIVPAAAKKKISLCAEMEEYLNVFHDVRWTEEAVHNLLDNAVKYTQEGGNISLFIKKREVFTELHVKDSGKGIAAERQASVFYRFYREPEVHEMEGAGIGLYLTRKIMELQGGYVTVDSAVGEGADFTLYFPNDRSVRRD